MSLHANCDGVQRRDFLKVGTLGMGGLSLAHLLRLEAQGAVAPSAAKAGILVYLGGGPSHMDTFDLKPEAPSEYRGEFKPVKTKASGVEICEHLPQLAAQADKFAVLRGVSHTLAAHEFGRRYMNTGNRPLPSLEFPGFASVVSKEMAGDPQLPKAVAIPNLTQSAGYLGIAYNALATGATPRIGQPFTVRGMSLRSGLTVADVERRQNLLEDLDSTFASFEKKSEIVSGLDEFSETAFSMMSSNKARQAFDISKENADLAKKFGDTGVGQSCLLAVRLVEAGVRFVTIEMGGWDTHNDNFTKLKGTNLPALDAALANLFASLADRGLLDSTVVMVTGEFGRTPKVNARAGRDHWPRAMSVLLGGGGIKGGQVVGASDDKGQGPAADAITPEAVAASVYRTLGIDHQREYQTSTGRPIMIVRHGEPIPQLFG